MEEEITRPFYGKFLMEVQEKGSLKSLIEPTVFQHLFASPRYFHMAEIYLTMDARYLYLEQIEKRIKYEPKIRELLNGKNWHVDGILLEKVMIPPVEYYQGKY